MITKMKIFETVYRMPKAGDHAITLDGDVGEVMWHNSSGGVKITGYNGEDCSANIENVEYWADTKEELDTYIQMKKYNL